MNDEELIESLSGAYCQMATQPVNAPPALDDLLTSISTRPVRLPPSPRRNMMVGVLAVAAALIGAVVLVARRDGEAQGRRTDYSRFRHVALSRIPEGYGLANARSSDDVTDVLEYRGPSNSRILLFASRPGSAVFSDVAGQRQIVELRGLAVERVEWNAVEWLFHWSETTGLDVWITSPKSLGDQLVEAVIPLTDRQWEAAIQHSGFVPPQPVKRVNIQALANNGGPERLEFWLDHSLQSGPVWFIGEPEQVNGASAPNSLVLGLVGDDPGPAYALTRDRDAVIEVNGVPASSTFAHPGYPDLFVVYVSALGRREFVGGP